MVELLAMVASYSTRDDHDGLHDGHTVPIGRPWVEGAEADHVYINRPYFVSQDFAALPYDDAFSVQFLWLVPITEPEKKWRHEHGQEAFEQLLEDHEPPALSREEVPHDKAALARSNHGDIEMLQCVLSRHGFRLRKVSVACVIHRATSPTVPLAAMGQRSDLADNAATSIMERREPNG